MFHYQIFLIDLPDPFSFKRSLTRFISSGSIFDFINTCFKYAYLYFGCVQTVKGPVIFRIVLPESKDSPTDGAAAGGDDEESAGGKVMTVEEVERAILGGDESENLSASTFEELMKAHGTILSPKMARTVSDLVPKNMINFQFQRHILTAGEVKTNCSRRTSEQEDNLKRSMQYLV